MISLCSVVINKNLEDYIAVLTSTLSIHASYVKEVILVQTDLRKDKLLRSWSKNGIDFKLYGSKPLNPPCPLGLGWQQMICDHAWGLQQALEYAQEEYVWMSDPDIFLLSPVDQIYLNLMQRYDLNLVGVSHFNSEGQSYLHCPCIINCMMKRKNLPPADWLGEFFAQSGMRLSDNCENVFTMNNCWLIPGPLPQYKSFPNPDGIFDTGCNLWLWNEEQQGKWLSFFIDTKEMAQKSLSYHLTQFATNNIGFSELVYPLNYNLCNYKTNFGLTDNLGNMDLLYHRTRGSRENAGSFRKLYESLYQVCP